MYLVSRSEATLQKLWPIWRTSAEKWEVLSSPRATPPGKTWGLLIQDLGRKAATHMHRHLYLHRLTQLLGEVGPHPKREVGKRVQASAWAFTVFCSSIQGSAFSSYAEYGGDGGETPEIFDF